MKAIEVLGMDRVNGVHQFASHKFDFTADGVQHYVSDQGDYALRATVTSANWEAYCAAVPEADEANKRLMVAANAAARQPDEATAAVPALAAPPVVAAPVAAPWWSKLLPSA